ncbi:terpenoid cyclases/Protein prenyltransferase [Rhodofomes roseus]|uniref:Protein farnesyltransferase subunit beta n=1 Tax=Rhodofomes roseus TaxID=34475 RepID=A0ABQ8KR96_9APHY|nr:terpenoid cyclases/Protein prenyltransferase [Rhodofomes roseus]KAH9840869.1 terpenoid cyclases/Protein prenyltransferase [Rhodofomes roseus]
MASPRDLRPTPTDGYSTATSFMQQDTEETLLAHLPQSLASGGVIASQNVPAVLQRNVHMQYLLRNLRQGFPQRYTGQDASQAWLMHWTFQAFSCLGVGMDGETKRKAREKILAMQHESGGFGGGPSQAPHLLATYAAVSALAVVGEPGPGGGWDEIDRQKMYEFFMSVKQSDGSFLVSHHGEVDVRGLYCLLAVATLLNLLTPELLQGVPEFIASCQTYEGGFGNASFPDWAFSTDGYDPAAPRPVLGEAHGGYTFCALASWVFLQPYLRIYYKSKPPSTADAPAAIDRIPPTINMRSLIRWLTHMQGTGIELGGFKGRTNKLVDGCYSWWVGGCFPLVDGLLGPGASAATHETETATKAEHAQASAEDNDWLDIDDALFNREALQEYVLFAGQHPAGGLRDKPPKHPDSYHTLYCLAGLSAAQHRVGPDHSRREALLQSWDADAARQKAVASGPPDSQERLDSLRRESFLDALCWLEDEGADKYVGGSANRVNATQPLFNLTITHTELMMKHFYQQNLPSRVPKAAATRP